MSYHESSVYFFFYSSVYSVYLLFFLINLLEDWYWPVEILITSAFFTLFDQSLQ